MPDPSDQAIEKMVERLAQWTVNQPDYPRLFLADRATRRRAARAVAYRLMILPTVAPRTVTLPNAEGTGDVVQVNRSIIRKQVQRNRHAMGQMMAVLSRQRTRQLAKAKRDQTRARSQRLKLAAQQFATGADESDPAFD